MGEGVWWPHLRNWAGIKNRKEGSSKGTNGEPPRTPPSHEEQPSPSPFFPTSPYQYLAQAQGERYNLGLSLMILAMAVGLKPMFPAHGRCSLHSLKWSGHACHTSALYTEPQGLGEPLWPVG